MPRNQTLLLGALAALSTSALVEAQATLTPLPGFGVNGWLAPGSNPYLGTLSNERGIAYNPTTGNLLLVSRANVAGNANNIRVLAGATGADLFGLDSTGIAGGTFTINMVDVDDVGAIYVGNLSTAAANAFRVYKWDSEAVGAVTPPTVAYSGTPGITRLGDSFAVQGGLFSPAQWAAAGSNNVSASNFAVGTLDGSNTATAFLSVGGTSTAFNDYRLGLTFVDSDTLIGNQGSASAPARMTTFDTTLVISTLDASIPIGGVTRRPIDYLEFNGRPLLASVDSATSQVTVFDLSIPTAPVILAQANNTTGVLTANGNGVGSVSWGPVIGNSVVLYAMSTNQGIQAFQLTLAPIATVANYGVGCDGLGIVANSLPTLGNLGFALDVVNIPIVSSFAIVGAGTIPIPGGISLVPEGMPGCFNYTNLDIGLFFAGPVSGGVSSFPIGINNTPSLAGASLAIQGASASTLTPAGYATSDAVFFVVGY